MGPLNVVETGGETITHTVNAVKARAMVRRASQVYVWAIFVEGRQESFVRGRKDDVLKALSAMPDDTELEIMAEEGVTDNGVIFISAC